MRHYNFCPCITVDDQSKLTQASILLHIFLALYIVKSAIMLALQKPGEVRLGFLAIGQSWQVIAGEWLACL